MRRVTSRGPGIKGAPGGPKMSPRHRRKKKVRTQSPENFRPDPKGRATGSRFTWRGKLHNGIARDTKSLMDSIRNNLNKKKKKKAPKGSPPNSANRYKPGPSRYKPQPGPYRPRPKGYKPKKSGAVNRRKRHFN